MIRVLVVDDSKLIAMMFEQIIAQDPEVEVVGIAENGQKAIEMAGDLKPDVITMDIHMPVMDGFEATKYIMAYNPTPILVVSASVFKDGMDKVFEALSYGALEVIDKTALEGHSSSEEMQRELIEKIKMLSRIRVVRHPLKKMEKVIRRSEAVQQDGGSVMSPNRKSKYEAVGIVASTGGTQALLEVLKSIPEDFPVPIFIVQHMGEGFVEGFVEWLDGLIPMEAKVTEAGEVPKKGTVYVAPAGKHLKVNEKKVLELDDSDPVEFQRPSGTVLLKSVAESYGDRAIGVILTGMGKDGVEGLKWIHKQGGWCIAQDEKTSVIFGMPKAAIDTGAVNQILPLSDVPVALRSKVGG